MLMFLVVLLLLLLLLLLFPIFFRFEETHKYESFQFPGRGAYGREWRKVGSKCDCDCRRHQTSHNFFSSISFSSLFCCWSVSALASPAKPRRTLDRRDTTIGFVLFCDGAQNRSGMTAAYSERFAMHRILDRRSF